MIEVFPVPGLPVITILFGFKIDKNLAVKIGIKKGIKNYICNAINERL